VKLGLITLGAACAVALAGCAPAFSEAVPPGGPKDATYADLGTARLRFVDEGEGPPVVLIHGFASALDTWRGVMKELVRQHHRVLAMDLKGFGWSSRPSGDYSPQAEAQLVLALMDQRNIKSAVIVGHSWGSSVALDVALAAPERVTKIALYDAWVYEEQLPTTFLWARASGVGEALFDLFYSERADEKIARAFYDPKKYVTERFVDEVEKALDRPGTVAAALAAVRGQRFEDQQKRYHELRQPVLLLWGRDDEVTLLPFGERLARDLPHAHLVVYPQCGHFPMIEAAGTSTDDLIKFLDEPAPAPAPPSQVAATTPTPAAPEKTP
jgi:pimeloyl-ACP methyl ester carboxylesterase